MLLAVTAIAIAKIIGPAMRIAAREADADLHRRLCTILDRRSRREDDA